MNNHGFKLKYKEVNADHPGMVPLVLPDVFNFFDSCRNNSVAVFTKPAALFANNTIEFSAKYLPPQSLRITLPPQFRSPNAMVSVFDIAGRKHYSGAVPVVGSKGCISDIMLPAGVYRAWIGTGSQNGRTDFMVVR
jgi:hypothetical protein